MTPLAHRLTVASAGHRFTPATVAKLEAAE